eukprot:Ihof_evm3s297 gene=Ihof_evmTU3s297
MLWQLPALLISWENTSPRWIGLVNIMALTQGLTLTESDAHPNFTQAWSTQNGAILFDVILLGLVVITRSVFSCELIEDVVSYERNDIGLTAKRATVLSSNLAKALRLEKARQRSTEEAADQLIRDLSERQHLHKNKDQQRLLFEKPSDLYTVDSPVKNDGGSHEGLSNMGAVRIVPREGTKGKYTNAYEQLQYWDWQHPSRSNTPESDFPAQPVQGRLAFLREKIEAQLWALRDTLEAKSRGYVLLVGQVTFSAPTLPADLSDRTLHHSFMHANNSHPSPSLSPLSLHTGILVNLDPDNTKNSVQNQETELLTDIFNRGDSLVQEAVVKEDRNDIELTGARCSNTLLTPTVTTIPTDTTTSITPERSQTSPEHSGKETEHIEGDSVCILGSEPEHDHDHSTNDQASTEVNNMNRLIGGTESEAIRLGSTYDGSMLGGVGGEVNLSNPDFSYASQEAIQAGVLPARPETSTNHLFITEDRGESLEIRVSNQRASWKAHTNRMFSRTDFSTADMEALQSDHFVVVDAEGNLRVLPDIAMDSSGMPLNFYGSAVGLVSCARQRLYTELGRAFLHYFLSHTAEVCYIAIVVNQIYHGNLLSTTLPVVLFTWGLLLRPWPAKAFWGFATVYVEIVICIKYLFQLDLWNFNEASPDTARWVYMLGIQKNPTGSFVWSEGVDLLLLLLLLFHRYMAQRLATWDYKDHIPVVPSASDTAHTSHDIGGPNRPENIPPIFVQDDFPTHNGDGGWNALRRIFMSPIIAFKEKLSEAQRVDCMSPRDYFGPQLAFDFIAFIITAVGWSHFSTDSGTLSEYISQSRVPLPFFLVLLGQFAIMMVDRIIYLTHNIIAKFCLQIFVCLGLNFYVTIILPDVIRDSTYSCSHRVTAIVGMFYAAKCMYLYYSALQLRHGYPRYLLSSLTATQFGPFYSTLFRVYRAVPFMMELRSLMDWVCTDTTLNLFEWWKLDEIYATLYLNKCRYVGLSKEERQIGKGKGLFEKLYSGVALIACIVLVIWLPLLVVSVGRVTSEPSLLGAFTMSLSINNVDLWSVTSIGQDISHVNETVFKALQLKYSTVGYRPMDVFVVNLQSASRTLWDISPPSRDLLFQLANNTKENLIVNLYVTVDRSTTTGDNQAASVVSGRIGSHIINASDSTRYILADILGTNRPARNITLPNLIPMAIHVPAKGPISSLLPVPGDAATCTLRLVSIPMSNSTKCYEWWELKQNDFLFDNQHHLVDPTPSIEVLTFNEPTVTGALSYVAGLGIMGIYVSV